MLIVLCHLAGDSEGRGGEGRGGEGRGEMKGRLISNFIAIRLIVSICSLMSMQHSQYHAPITHLGSSNSRPVSGRLLITECPPL